ncbi:MAG: glucose-1-phosphate adenylyltransferase subunit GlgD [Clostridiales bacterium]|nr:glucose-1-phosphate adenylyltransferase subunit GlgD [Clostridiales bacterium]
MKDVMGVIYTGEKDDFLRDLTKVRAIAAMPVCGRYRVIDFLVSSMVNSGMRNVGVIMQKNYQSLMDHLGSGKEWDLHGKNDGLFILPPFLNADENNGVYKGSIDALHSNMGYLRRSRQEYVLLTNSLIVYNANFTDAFAKFKASDADIMMLYTRNPAMQRANYGAYLDVDENGMIRDLEVDPTKPKYENTSMDVFIMKKSLLLDLVDTGAAHRYHELLGDIILRSVRDNGMKVMGYEYTDLCYRLDSVENYLKFNMDCLDPDIRHQLFPENRPVYTKVRDQLAARYMEGANVINSMVADGSMINGTVEHSVLFRGVKIGKGAHVKNCIIMQDGVIEDGVYLENCILDKNVFIKAGEKVIGTKYYPVCVDKGGKIL